MIVAKIQVNGVTAHTVYRKVIPAASAIVFPVKTF